MDNKWFEFHNVSSERTCFICEHVIDLSQLFIDWAWVTTCFSSLFNWKQIAVIIDEVSLYTFYDF